MKYIRYLRRTSLPDGTGVWFINQQKFSVPVACVVMVVEPGDGRRFGISFCHPNDNFNYKLAREIAEGRAAKWTTQKMLTYVASLGVIRQRELKKAMDHMVREHDQRMAWAEANK